LDVTVLQEIAPVLNGLASAKNEHREAPPGVRD
jgi:hypothetical protein